MKEKNRKRQANRREMITLIGGNRENEKREINLISTRKRYILRFFWLFLGC